MQVQFLKATAICVAAIACIGCSGDAKSTFEKNVIPKYKERVQSVCRQMSNADIDITFDEGSTSYNVIKTNSEVSPQTGFFEYTVTANSDGKTASQGAKVSLAFQNGKWVFRDVDFPPTDYDTVEKAILETKLIAVTVEAVKFFDE